MPVDVMMPPDCQQSQIQGPMETLRYLELHGDESFVSIFDRSKLKLGLLDYLVLVEELHIMGCSNIVQWPMDELRCFPHLRSLHIVNCFKLEGSEEEEILPLPQLERLHMYGCGRLLKIPKLPASLEEIEIHNSGSLVALPSSLRDLVKLRRLAVWNCGGLKALPHGMDGLTSLEQLWIDSCPGMEKFPQGLLQRLPALKRLQIIQCPGLQRRCREGGEYFDLVASIPDKYIPAPAQAQPWFLPSYGGASQGN
ncbi:unnamed protein product [Urochloa humidicola]